MTETKKNRTNLVDVGSILRTARETRKISVEEAAEALHLRPSVVAAIEKNDFSGITGEIFLKGYIRSYARLVQVPEERILTQLDHVLLDRKLQTEETRTQQETARKRAIMRRRRSLSLAVLLVFVGGGLAAYYSLDHPLSLFGSGSQPTAQTEKEKAESAASLTEKTVSPVDKSEAAQVSRERDESSVVRKEKTPEENMAMDQNPPVQSTLVSDGTGAESDEPGDETLAAGEVGTASENPVSAEVEPEPKSMAASSRTVVEATGLEDDDRKAQSTEAQAVQAPVNPGGSEAEASLVARFAGDSWVQIKNGDGKTVVAALKRGGETLRYTGKPPFTVVLGDATVVQLTYNDKPVDLERVKLWRKRAQFTLGDEVE